MTRICLLLGLVACETASPTPAEDAMPNAVPVPPHALMFGPSDWLTDGTAIFDGDGYWTLRARDETGVRITVYLVPPIQVGTRYLLDCVEPSPPDRCKVSVRIDFVGEVLVPKWGTLSLEALAPLGPTTGGGAEQVTAYRYVLRDLEFTNGDWQGGEVEVVHPPRYWRPSHTR